MVAGQTSTTTSAIDHAATAHSALTPSVRAALDAARALAALYVVVHHVAKAHGWSGLLGHAFRFGQEAVLVFFLLSGFVIFANERVRALRPRGYLWRRLRRIYPPLIVAVAVSTLVAWDNGDLAARFDVRSLLGTLLGWQDVSALKPGVLVDPYLGNDPLWSLSYELGFYLLFPLVLAAWVRAPRMTDHAIGAGCCAAYVLFAMAPNHVALVVAYFPVWWVGAMAARAWAEGGRSLRTIGPSFGWLLVLCVVAAGVTLVAGYRGPGVYPMLPLRHFVIAAILVVLCFGPIGGWLVRLPVWRVGWWSGIAGISYGLYVLHMPLLVDWHRADGVAGFAVATIALVGLAWAVERILPRILPPAPKD